MSFEGKCMKYKYVSMLKLDLYEKKTPYKYTQDENRV